MIIRDTRRLQKSEKYANMGTVSYGICLKSAG